MSKKGILTVVSGFSGAGKGTVMKELLNQFDYGLSISATTRAPRQGEIDGKEYFFLTRDKFESMIEQNQLFEWAEYVGNYYGTPKKYVEEQLELGKNVILEIEIQGALKVKEQFEDALLLFITPPNAEELKKRLINRGTETIETIQKRLIRASEEAEYMNCYDYIVVNDDLKACVEQINQIIMNEHSKSSKNKEFIKEISNELEAFKRGEF
ncbi:guanylate kinase [Anaeromicropila herbilytica]|uniref:Guanylate kinase n=1 Tax=Anaeromicropila herbilytica TaxID=2785025 RepID=A0A7R7EML9_9FIRM|nr:guanylate kinase [Anaeromicropila herbilytica]BCN31587.1 guanylate kinase [Anaeromicropila herbilytica]